MQLAPYYLKTDAHLSNHRIKAIGPKATGVQNNIIGRYGPGWIASAPGAAGPLD